MALLHSPGPDGDVDVSLPRLHSILHDTLEKKTEGAPRLIFTKKTEACFMALLDRFGYDPKNGLASNGDLIQLYVQTGKDRAFGPGREQPASDQTDPSISPAEMDSLLEKWPEGVAMPLPRWRDSRGEKASLPLGDNWFPVREPLYRLFERYLAVDDPAAAEALASLANRLGAFAEFFAEVGPLSEEPMRLLAQWREDDPGWWDLIDRAPTGESDEPFVYADIGRYAQFYVFYGKSSLLRAGELLGSGDFKRADRIACWLEHDARNLEYAYYVKPAPPVAQRAGAEIRRMASRLGALAQMNLPVEAKM